MSTPVSSNNKIEGLDLYAPKWARGQSAESAESEENASPLKPPSVSPNGEPDTHDSDSETTDPAEPHAAAQTRLQAAVQAVVDVERDIRETSPAPASSPAAVMPPKDDGIEWPLPPLKPQHRMRRLDRGMSLHARLGPDVVPEPPADVQRRIMPVLMRFSVIVGVAAAVAYCLTVVPTLQPQALWPKQASDALAAIGPLFQHEPAAAPQVPAPAQSHLVVENRRAFVNEPLPLGVSVASASGNESLLLAGLAAGTRLSAGAPVNDSSWRLPSHELKGLYLYAPKNFVGVMNTAIDLLSPNQRLLDSRAVRFEWIVKKDEPSAPAPGVSSIKSGHEDSPAAAQQLDAEQVTTLMKRGRDSLSSGDIMTARLVFRRLAVAGNAEAALALASTYDPHYLASQGVIGVQGDGAEAHAWYQRAMELGSKEAKDILATATK